MLKYEGELYIFNHALNCIIDFRDKLLFSGVAKFLASPMRGKRVITSWVERFRKDLVLKPKGFDFIVRLNALDDSHHVIYKELFVENIYDFEKLNFEPDIIIDCGAHIGFFTVLANSRFKGVQSYAFEPNEENVSYIRKNCKQNNLATEVITAAVSDYNGSSWFSFYLSYAGSLEKDKSNKSVEVKVVDFVDFVSKNKNAKMLLKMDIEGEEENLLPKVLPHLPEQTAIFFETHSGIGKYNDMVKSLEESGFKIDLTRVRDIYFDAFAQRLTNL